MNKISEQPRFLFLRVFFVSLAWMCSASQSEAARLPESIVAKEGARVLWDFETSQDDWTFSKDISNLRALNGCLRGTATGGDPYVLDGSGRQLALQNVSGVTVKIRLSQDAPLQLYWENEDGGFSQLRSETRTVPGQQWTTVRFDLRSHPEWAGKTIEKIRLDPGAAGVDFAIDYVALLDRFTSPDTSMVPKEFDFETGREGWTASSSSVQYFRRIDGKLKGYSSGTDPWMASPTFAVGDPGGVMFQFRCADPLSIKFYWATTEGGFSEARTVTREFVGKEWQVVRFDLRDHPEWAGKTITRIRIDPGSSVGSSFELDAVAMLSKSAFSDGDGDLLTNIEELIHKGNPGVPDRLPSKLLQERWNGQEVYSTRKLVTDKNFYSPADAVGPGRVMAPGVFDGIRFFSRSRGYIIAPETGTYRFWVTGRVGAELYLSPDDTKYRKDLIAELNPDIGTGYGVEKNSPTPWDNYVSQMSGEIYLEAGQRYYIEALQGTGYFLGSHLRIAWARPGRDRELLNPGCIESYCPESEDADDDFLPDAWETQYGLNSSDNGFADIHRQGERGDFDGDGLSNREEFLFGTDPANPDTDGDGIGDFAEVHFTGTDPLVSDTASATPVSSVDIMAQEGSDLAWTATGSGMVADNFRGWIEWNFSVPHDGVWVLDLATALRGTRYGRDTIAFSTSIDGMDTGRRQLTYGPGPLNTLRIITPHLVEGVHSLRLEIDNMIARRTVEIRSLEVMAPSGPDLDGNGVVDWIEAILDQSDYVIPHSLASKTSPFCLEGHSMVVSGVHVNDEPVTTGVDGNHWFTELDLDPANVTDYTVVFSSGVTHTSAILWETTDVLASDLIAIRKGDTLKLGAAFESGNGPATLSVEGQEYMLVGGGNGIGIGNGGYGSGNGNGHGAPLHTFTNAGTFTVTATRSGADPASMTVSVADADFGTLPALAENVPTTWVLQKSMVSPDLFLEPGRNLGLGAHEDLGANSYSHTLFPEAGGRLAVAARLGQQGPILALAEFGAVGFSDALQNDLSTVSDSPGFPNNYVLTTPLVFTDLPPGATIEITAFRSGVSFLDGSSKLTLTAADLDNGVVNVSFLINKGLTGGYCHYVTIYDADGNVIATR